MRAIRERCTNAAVASDTHRSTTNCYAVQSIPSMA